MSDGSEDGNLLGTGSLGSALGIEDGIVLGSLL